jgi:hypothetical protein
MTGMQWLTYFFKVEVESDDTDELNFILPSALTATRNNHCQYVMRKCWLAGDAAAADDAYSSR